MNDWKVKLEKETVFFVTPDIKRGLGFEGILPNFHLVCSYNDPVIMPIRENGANVCCLEDLIGAEAGDVNNSGKLLQNPHVLNYIRQHARGTPYIAFFKPSIKMDVLIRDLGFLPLGNSADKNEMFENKVNLNKALREIIPGNKIPFLIGKMGLFNYDDLKRRLGDKFVVQFGHGWAGKTTYFVFNKDRFSQLQKTFGETNVRVSKYVQGITFLNNCCIYRENILVGPPALQVNGISQLCDNPTVTCGRQWPDDMLSDRQTDEIGNISGNVGKVMQKSGFKGIFGIDFLMEEETGRIYLSEVNARMTASTSFYTKMEMGLGLIPFMAYHFAAFTGKDLPVKCFSGGSEDELKGSQLILRKEYQDSRISGLDNFGVYEINWFRKKQNQFYQPENLKDEEFIYIRRLKKDIKPQEDEFARIETQEKIMEDQKTLKKWVGELLNNCN